MAITEREFKFTGTGLPSVAEAKKKNLKRGKKAAQALLLTHSKDEIISAGDWLLEQMTIEELTTQVKSEEACTLARKGKGKGKSPKGAKQSK